MSNLARRVDLLMTSLGQRAGGVWFLWKEAGDTDVAAIQRSGVRPGAGSKVMVSPRRDDEPAGVGPEFFAGDWPAFLQSIEA